MSFFDVFQEANITLEDGSIRQYYEERYEGMLLGDKMRQALVWEEYDDPDAWDLVHQDKYQNEFIFKLFQVICLGGGVSQYETNINDYLNIVKLLYKDLVCVAKDSDTQQIKSFTQVFRVDKLEGHETSLYTPKEEGHPQNCLYVCVDPINWHVNFFYNKWIPYW